MNGSAEIAQLIAAHGLWILAPLAVLEGPIVTVIASWLARLGLLDPLAVFVCVVIADLVGDGLMYWAGRGVRLDRLPVIGRYLRIPRSTLVPLVKAFRERGVRLLVVGKLTHAAGFAFLIAAGAARMPFALFLLVNFLASIPKCLAFMALGWVIGAAHQEISRWLSLGSGLVLGLVAMAALVGFVIWRRRKAAS
jgi:membrane protein DedA with SNARE-associated domain